VVTAGQRGTGSGDGGEDSAVPRHDVDPAAVTAVEVVGKEAAWSQQWRRSGLAWPPGVAVKVDDAVAGHDGDGRAAWNWQR
jgi:hypothetical protein